MSEQFLTPAEVAQLLKLKKNTVYEMIKRGDLKASKLGKQLRIQQSDLDAYLSGKTAIKQPVIHSSVTPDAAKFSSGESIIVCGQDIILDKLCNRINEADNGPLMLRSHKGSYNALNALYNNHVQIATAHLWDAQTNTYNLPYISKLLPGIPVYVYHVLNRRQGFYVPKGNPKNIHSFEDFKRTDLIYVNREKGCGTRILLDQKLLLLGIDFWNVRGYDTETTSHLDAATAVAMGNADFALGNERTSMQIPDIEFIPLQEEQYDMIIPAQYMKYPAYQAVVDVLRDKAFQQEVELMGGYDVTNMGKLIFSTKE